MPFDPLPIPAVCPVLTIGAGQVAVPIPAGGGPVIAAFDAPASIQLGGFWGWFNRWVPVPRYVLNITGDVSTNTGIYGPNPPAIAGQYGKEAAPAIGLYAVSYSSLPRSMQAGRYYVVVRPQAGAVLTSLLVGLAKV